MEGNNSVMDTIVDGPLFPRNRTHMVVDDVGEKCSTIVVENPFIKQCPGLQSFAEITVGVEFNDGGIPRINSSISSFSLVLGKTNANSKAQPLKVLVVRYLSF